MRKVSVVALAIVFLLSALFPVSYTTEAAGGRQILEQKYSDTWEEAMNLYSEAIGDPDVDLKYTGEDGEEDINIPINLNFFWPDA